MGKIDLKRQSKRGDKEKTQMISKKKGSKMPVEKSELCTNYAWEVCFEESIY